MRGRSTSRGEDQQHGVAAEPAEAGALRRLALEDGTGVDVGAREREAAADVAFDPFQQLQQLALEDLVVVAAAIRKILDCLGLPSRPPPIAPATQAEADATGSGENDGDPEPKSLAGDLL
jgi:hypothetical protein